MAPSLGERKRERTREAVADTALRLFAARGFDQVTVEEIAAASEVSPRTFFRYFATKEDTLFSESDAGREALLRALADQPGEASAVDALQSAMGALAAYYADMGERLRLRHQVVVSSPSLRTRAAERQQRWESDVVEHLRASGRADHLGPFELRLLVASATTALRVAIEAWVAEDADGGITDLVDAAFQRLRAGFQG